MPLVEKTLETKAGTQTVLQIDEKSCPLTVLVFTSHWNYTPNFENKTLKNVWEIALLCSYSKCDCFDVSTFNVFMEPMPSNFKLVGQSAFLLFCASETKQKRTFKQQAYRGKPNSFRRWQQIWNWFLELTAWLSFLKM